MSWPVSTVAFQIKWKLKIHGTADSNDEKLHGTVDEIMKNKKIKMKNSNDENIS